MDHKVQDHIKPGDIIRIDGRLGDRVSVTVWTVRNRKYATPTHNPLILLHSELFPHTMAERVTISKQKTEGYLVTDCRTQSSPQWPDAPTATVPAYIAWAQDKLRLCGNEPNYRIYTDGSYKTTASVPAVFNPGLTKTKASASIVITSGTRDWKRHTVYVIHISDGHTIQAGSAYTMEFIALAAALKLQTLCKNSATAQQPIVTSCTC